MLDKIQIKRVLNDHCSHKIKETRGSLSLSIDSIAQALAEHGNEIVQRSGRQPIIDMSVNNYRLPDIGVIFTGSGAEINIGGHRYQASGTEGIQVVLLSHLTRILERKKDR